jgi:hypothetical protein
MSRHRSSHYPYGYYGYTAPYYTPAGMGKKPTVMEKRAAAPTWPSPPRPLVGRKRMRKQSTVASVIGAGLLLATAASADLYKLPGRGSPGCRLSVKEAMTAAFPVIAASFTTVALASLRWFLLLSSAGLRQNHRASRTGTAKAAAAKPRPPKPLSKRFPVVSRPPGRQRARVGFNLVVKYSINHEYELQS